MPVLDCSVRTCFYNKSSQCCLNTIKVEGSNAKSSTSTSCASFRMKSDDSFTNSTDKDPNTSLEIDCRAQSCVFNDNRNCHAAHIGIAGNGAKKLQETQCASFYKD